VQEYIDPLRIKEDIGWRTISEIRDNLLAVRWISVQDLISTVYKDFNHKDTCEAIEFFKERNLM
jgi:hypothetical protein